MKKKIALLMFFVLLSSVLFACSNGENKATKDNSTKDTANAEVKNDESTSKDKIVLGTSADFPPMEWIKYDGSKEEYIGVDIEIAKAIAKDLGKELEVKNMGFDGLIPSLNAGDVDFVIAGMAATPTRKKSVDFSEPYSSFGQVLLVRGEDKDKYKSFDDLEGKKIGTQLSTLQNAFAEEKYGSENVVAMDNNNNLILELKNGTLDCLFLSELPARQFATINPDLAVINNIGVPNEDGSAVAVKKGNEELLQSINKTIKDLKDSGQIQKWIDEYIELSSKEVEANK